MVLAAYVLGDTSSALALVRDSLLVTHERRLIRLERAVPVHVMYRTAWVDSTGVVQFRNDVYGYDAQLDSFLVAPRTRTWMLNPDSLRTAWRAEQRRERALAP
jgi:murein L,D-transpeptidase YcbB/YkuD